MKHIIQLDGSIVVFNTRKAKLLWKNTSRNPSIKFYIHCGRYFKTSRYYNSREELYIFVNLYDFIINLSENSGTETAIKIFNLKELTKAEDKPLVLNKKRDIQI